MKLKYLLVLFLLPALLISSCKRDDDRIFETNATVRMTEAVQNAYTVLQANKAGWMMNYYPSKNQEFGGYTIFTKFISNAKVSIASDPIKGIETSSYIINPESGPVLSFDGFNKSIHWFSEPGMDNGGIGPDDSGMQGDFEFIVLKATADSVVLKGKKSGSHLVMLPLKGTEFENLSASYQEAANKFKQFDIFNLVTADGKSVKIGYDPKVRVFSNPDDPTAKDMSFRVVPGGLEFYEEYTIGKTAFDRVSFIEPTGAYPNGYYTDKGNTFKIVPIAPTLNQWFKSKVWFMSYKNVGSFGQKYWDNAKTKLNTNKISLNSISLGDRSVEVFYYVLQNGAVVGAIGHDIGLVDDTNDQVKISLEGSVYGVRGDFGTNFLTYWSGGLNEFTRPLNGRTFKITADQMIKPEVVLLTDISDATNTFKVFLKDINDPLNN